MNSSRQSAGSRDWKKDRQELLDGHVDVLPLGKDV